MFICNGKNLISCFDKTLFLGVKRMVNMPELIQRSSTGLMNFISTVPAQMIRPVQDFAAHVVGSNIHRVLDKSCVLQIAI